MYKYLYAIRYNQSTNQPTYQLTFPPVFCLFLLPSAPHEVLKLVGEISRPLLVNSNSV